MIRSGGFGASFSSAVAVIAVLSACASSPSVPAASAATPDVGNGGAQMLVLRWDGNCYTLEEGELTAKKPPSVKTGPIPWRRYLDPTRDALLARPRVLAAFQKRGKECKGAISGEVSRACEQADDASSAAVVAEIRAGTTIPTPSRLP